MAVLAAHPRIKGPKLNFQNEEPKKINMKGTFDLLTPRDLLEKLKHDFKVLESDPDNTYSAFNFFITAEHIKDWIFPGRANKTKREDLDKSSLLLQVCSHVANGAKHFEVGAKHHQSVSDTVRFGSHFPKTNSPSNRFPKNKFPKGILKIELKGEAEKQFGTRVGVVDLAKKILAYWVASPEIKQRASK
jgi:hypothetical protein